jgi:hypothetical protein
MSSREFRIRGLIEAIFFLCLFAAFLWEALGNYFCTESGREIAVRQSLNIAFALSVWDAVAIAAGLIAARALRGYLSPKASCLWIGGGVAAVGYFAAVCFLAPGGQPGPFLNALDSSCFFTEGYGMMFPLTWAPLLVIMTTLRELLTRMVLRRV